MYWFIKFRVNVCDMDDDFCELTGELVLKATSIDEALVKARNYIPKLTDKDMLITRIEYEYNGD